MPGSAGFPPMSREAPGTLRKAVSALLSLWALSTPVSCGAPETLLASVGAFEIRVKARRLSSGRFPNLAANPFEKVTVSDFRIYHQGVRQKAPMAGDGAEDTFWEALVLDGAPRPALVLATSAVYLMHEQEGRVRVEQLSPGGDGTATLQWIDGPGDRPGPVHPVSHRDCAREPRQFQGGRYLLVNARTVLDVATLTHWTLSRGNPVALQQVLQGYYGDWIPRWLSPGRTQFAFVGSRLREDSPGLPGHEYALIVEAFRAGRCRLLPFDAVRTRFHVPQDAPSSWFDRWFAHHFRWRQDSDGEERLDLREGVPPLPWCGLLRRDGQGRATRYDLERAAPSLGPALEAFLQRDFGSRRLAREELPGGFTQTTLDLGPCTLHLRYASSPVPVLTLDAAPQAPPTPDAAALLERIATRFEAELAQGRHQTHFLDL